MTRPTRVAAEFAPLALRKSMATDPLSRKRVQLNGITTAYLDGGRGEPIVALHGIPTSSLLFAPLAPFLPDVRLIAPDLLGLGKTEVPQAGRLDYSAYTVHLRAFLEAVPPQRFHLLVHDFGSVLGLHWAADNLARVKSLLILSTTITESFRVSWLLYAANLVLDRNFLRWGMPFTPKRSQKLDPALMEEWVAPWSRRRLPQGKDLFAGRHLRLMRSRLTAIRVPVLVIWGEQDDIFPLRHAAQIAQALPQARMHVLQRCGHWSPLDAPAEVLD